MSVTNHLGKVTYAAEKTVCYSGCAAAAEGNLMRGIIVNPYIKNRCTAFDYLHELHCVVILKSTVNPKTRT